MYQAVKTVVFYGAKWLGLFAIARRLHRHKVRILGYHGFTLVDEHQFVPGLFMETSEFDRRMRYLKEQGYRVLPLHQAHEEIEQGEIGPDSVVITIDDGFYSTLTEAAPILAAQGFPSTLYLTSYYFDEPCPIFTLAVDYMFWKSGVQDVDLQELGLETSDTDKATNTQPGWTREHIKTHGQALPGNSDRERLLQRLGDLLQVNYEALKASRILNLIDQKEAGEIQEAGVDIQLHSHRHRFPVDEALSGVEIDDNRAAMQHLANNTLQHFCYPSGEWDERHWPVLQQKQVLTATTCESGFVDEKTPPLAMNRILDSARVTQIEFEAEVSGFNELLRRLRGAA